MALAQHETFLQARTVTQGVPPLEWGGPQSLLDAQDQNPNPPDHIYFESLILKVPAWVLKKNLLNCFPKHDALEKQKVGSRWINMSYIRPYSYL